MNKIYCENCGSEQLENRDDTYFCKHCHTTWRKHEIDEVYDKLASILDEQKQERVANLRSQLYDALNAENIDSDEIIRICSEIREFLPDDFQAKFFYIANKKSSAYLAKYMRNLAPNKHIGYVPQILDFVLRSLQKSLIEPVNFYIEHAYGNNKNAELYEHYNKILQVEAQKVEKGIYDPSIPRDVFVAYSSDDIREMMNLVEGLRNAKLTYFVALSNLQHGKGSVVNYETNLQKAMDSCKVVVLVSSVKSRTDSDAYRLELPYVKKKDIENCPPKYRNNYEKLPIEFKKPRVEYIIEKHQNLPAEKFTREFFNGFERLYDIKEVVDAVYNLKDRVVIDDNKPEKKDVKYCAYCGFECATSFNVCPECEGKEFVKKHIDYTNIRRKKDNERDELENNLREQIGSLQADLNDRDEEISKLKAENQEQINVLQQTKKSAEDKIKEETNARNVAILEAANLKDKLAEAEKARAAAENEKNEAEKTANDAIAEANKAKNDKRQAEEQEKIEHAQVQALRDMMKKSGKYGRKVETVLTAVENAHTPAAGRRAKKRRKAKQVAQQFFVCLFGILSMLLSVGIIVATYLFSTQELFAYNGIPFIVGVGADFVCVAALITTAMILHRKDAKYESFGVGFWGSAIGAMLACAGVVISLFIKVWPSPYSSDWLRKLLLALLIIFGAFAMISAILEILLGENTYKSVSRIVICALCFGLFGFATMTGIGDILQWNNESKGYILNKDGSYTFMIDKFLDENMQDIVIPAEYMGRPVTKLTRSADADMSFIKTLYVPATVTSWDEGLLAGCGELQSIALPYIGYASTGKIIGYEEETQFVNPLGYLFGQNEYQGASAIRQYYYGTFTNGSKEGERNSYISSVYYIPDSLRNVTVLGGDICYGAFYGCANISNVILKNNVKSIDEDAFRGCDGLRYITIPTSVETISEDVFEDCDNIDTVTISENFKYNLSIIGLQGNYKHIEFLQPDLTLENCGSWLFEFEGTVLKKYNGGEINVQIPSGVTSIAPKAFEYCINLTSIIIPDTVNEICDYAFAYCRSLKSISIPDSVTQFGINPFVGCDAIESINVDWSNTTYKADGNCLMETSTGALIAGCRRSVIPEYANSIADEAFKDCTGIKDVTIPSSVQSIGKWAFSGCTGLNEISIPYGVTSMGAYVFNGCSNLRNISLPIGLTSISGSAFYGCESLMSVTLPNSITSIGYAAFYGCKSLTSFKITRNVKDVGENAFYGCYGLLSFTMPSKFEGAESAMGIPSTANLYYY